MVKQNKIIFGKIGDFIFYVQGFIATVCVLALIGYGLYLLIMYIRSKTEKYNNDFTCTMTFNDINPNLVNEYMKYDNKRITNGICKNGTLKMVVNTCADIDGVQSPNCKPNVSVLSSKGYPISNYSNTNVSFEEITKFFGVV